MGVQIKRVYDTVSQSDGVRILVDGIWPRGIKKEDLSLDFWFKDAAPSISLRKWFSHDKDKWEEFKKLYFAELKTKAEILDKLTDIAKNNNKLTLLYSARNRRYNQAAALKEFLENEFDISEK
ncbi:protein of unknown function DUF488 [Flexistipes sinusarabici DSM 4947]|uniref:DUF488 domain-containing protein n=2 Tax=Flexistipes sinusarabici TaxID=2352 RepID=F8E7D7_FLESM|nr:DUF488 family protein [Flexistipes sinusarabici]AEI13852.1 protein of unknown function DUF488 [Flexistipes sinusarabici DSM 4947]HCW92111.1 DUF488 domain-containing protein [Flexistipes sinusarabici]